MSLEGSGEYDTIRVIMKKYGSAGFVIKDGGAEYRYKVEVYEDNSGHSQIRVTRTE